MPDLSKRPERYATFLVAAVVAGTFAYSALGVRFGPDHRLAEMQAQNNKLARQLAAERAAAHTANAASTSGAVVQKAIDAVVARKNCSAFPNQEAAQAYWVRHKAQYAAWDGNHNGIACEQLKHAKQPAGTVRTRTVTLTRTVTQIVKENAAAASHEPVAPVTPSLPPVAVKPTAPSKATIVASRQHFGLFTDTQDEYTNLEATLARDTTMHGYFQGWDTDFNAADVNSAWAAGEIPFLTWESRPLSGGNAAVDYSLDNIAAGGFDSYLRKYADDIKANGLPLVIRFDQEMNGNWYRWAEPDPDYTNSKGSYILAWRHVHDIFQAEGANDLVVWDWSPNRTDNIKRLPTIDNYYPGDDYVDWIGMTGYYRPGDKAPTFSSTYDSTLNSLRAVAPTKPILLSEVGATEAGGHKLGWVNDFFAGLAANPDIIGFAWFDYAVTQNNVTNDWRIESTPAVTAAFRTGLYATGFGRDKGKKPILITTPPPSPTPSTSGSSTSSASSAAPSSASSSSGSAAPSTSAVTTSSSARPSSSSAAPSTTARASTTPAVTATSSAPSPSGSSSP